STGGEPSEARPFDEGEKSQHNPRFLPDGKHFLYYSRNQDSAKDGIYVASLDQKENRKLVLKGVGVAEYVSPGYLMFSNGNSLVAQQFNTASMELIGNQIR